MDSPKNLKEAAATTTDPPVSKRSIFSRSFIRRDSKLGDYNDPKKGPLGLTTLHSPNRAEPVVADVVFVHGLNGGSQSTWTKGNKPLLFWPCQWLPEDEAFRDVRIHTFGYSSSISQQSILNVPDFAASLLAAVHDAPAIPRDDTVWLGPCFFCL